MSQVLIAEQQERNVKSRVYDLAKKIGTRNGFFEYYFKIVLRCNSQKQAFELVNQIHYLIYDEFRYNCYHSFLNQRKKMF
ncbi:hypothetical protein [Tenacibaculum sp. 190524A02b]|uniref:Uncharacterized protein n=1 Tax=Tenacibaculum vairaonense TaxID=3137860 RepID=A0ABP1FCQ7_9FLAO